MIFYNISRKKIICDANRKHYYHASWWERIAWPHTNLSSSASSPCSKIGMIKNCCVVDRTNFVGKKKGLSFYFCRFPLRDVPDEKQLCCCEKGSQAHIPESAVNIMSQVRHFLLAT